MKPRFEPKPKVITAQQFADGFYVTCGNRFMLVGYLKIATYNNGDVLVRTPVWQNELP